MPQPPPSLHTATAPEPVGGRERVALIDALRGLALMGILLVNMAYYASPIGYTGRQRTGIGGWGDRIADAFVLVFAEGKFYPIFSLLFGLGLFLQMTRADAAGVGFRGRWLRRMLLLLGFGLAHALLVWDGDVLVYYAIFGTVLLLYRRRPDRSLIRWACTLLLVPALLLAAGAGLVTLIDDDPKVAAEIDKEVFAELNADREQATRIYQGDDWVAMVRHRAREYPETLGSIAAIMGPAVLAMFLLGVLIARRGLLHAPDDHAPALLRLLRLGLLVGVPLTLVQAYLVAVAGNPTARLASEDLARMLLSLALMPVAGPPLALAYVAAVALAWRRPGARRVLEFFAPVGRMALTSYLLQSLVATTIFYGYGLGLYGKLGAAMWIAVAISIYAAEVALARWWLARHRFGPAEWLWRTLTYGRRQPMRRPASSVPVAG